LLDGAPLGRFRQPEGTLYLACASRGKALLVGRRSCQVLDLADGAMVEVATGVPAGLGVAGEDVYYLPVRALPDQKQSAVCVVHLDRSPVQVEMMTARNERLGNLLFSQDAVLSQTSDGIAAYPRRKPAGTIVP
jgi:hypothetical protein